VREDGRSARHLAPRQAGGADLSGGQSAAQQLKGLLESRMLANAVIQKNNLMPVLLSGKDNNTYTDVEREQMARMLAGSVTVNDDKKTGLLTMSIKFTSPQIAAHIANAYTDALEAYLSQNNLTTARRSRVFLENQLEENKREMLEAGKELKLFYSAGQVPNNVEPRINVPLFLKSSENPELASLQKAYDRNQELLKKNEKSAQQKVIEGVPHQVYLEYLVLRKEVLIKINALLAQQYALAKVEESKEELAFQVIDSASQYLTRTQPSRSLLLTMALILSTALACFIILFKEFFHQN
jgi:uncharacterized protein involved in exopolysaccharide biosynthesis